ncbi:MAG TPA: hypothetical protein VGO67_08700 [Verrucomicrobiae bacterium]|jgi:hypothetical protein
MSPILAAASGGDFQITAFDPDGQITWTNAFTRGVCTVETSSVLGAAWTPRQNFFTTNSFGIGTFAPLPTNAFLRVRAVQISTNTPQAFTNLIQSYGLLHTIAGSGADAGNDNVSYWQPYFEGAFATNVALSRPHMALGDTESNVFIVDKNSHSVLKLTPDGRIHTVAGTHNSGNGPDVATVATNVDLNQPNGLWIATNNVIYILDTGNSKVRRLNTNGMMTTTFTDNNGIDTGRGLWVRRDEALVFYCSGNDLMKWTPSGGTSKFNKQFNELGNIIVSGTNLVVTDRGDNTVWLVSTNTGARTLLFGNGKTSLVVDGTLAVTNSLYGVRGVWQPPIGGYLLATDEGAQLLYVDITGVIHILVNGFDDTHSGDGKWFYSLAYKFGQLRSVSMDNYGNLLIVENDLGYVRRIDFQRLTP